MRSGFLGMGTLVMRKRVLSLLSVCLLNACVPAWQKPEVSVAELRLAGGNILQQRLKLQLRVKNPNAMDIGLESLAFDLLVGEYKLGAGQSLAPVTIPLRGEALVEIEMKANLLSLLSRLAELTAADGKLHYRLQGEAQISRYGRAPFDQPGELDVSRLQGLGGVRPVSEARPIEPRL